MLFRSIITLSAFLLLQIGVEAIPFDVLRGRDLVFPRGINKIRGVNLGGWLVLEPWITPSLFSPSQAVDEYHLCKTLGAACKSRLNQHWSTFITQSDLRAIKAAGLNHVRIPIGYWAVLPLPGDPYVQGQLDYLEKAVRWAAQEGLHVWIDLHGAPGSQNGFDNSGLRGGVGWMNGNGYVTHTKQVIRMLAKRFSKPEFAGVVSAIELLNEPMGPSLDMSRLRQFWMDGWGIVREYGNIAVVIGDAFASPPDWNGFMTSWSNVILDTHQYQVFSAGQVAMGIDAHVASACGIGRMMRQTDKPTVCGEWTGALTDCAKWLNGIGRGMRYDGTFDGSPKVGSCKGRVQGSIAQFSEAARRNTRRFIEAQLDAYEYSAGWFFWTWKTEGAPEWEMRDLIAHGVFPQPLTERRFGNQCGF